MCATSESLPRAGTPLRPTQRSPATNGNWATLSSSAGARSSAAAYISSASRRDAPARTRLTPCNHASACIGSPPCSASERRNELFNSRRLAGLCRGSTWKASPNTARRRLTGSAARAAAASRRSASASVAVTWAPPAAGSRGAAGIASVKPKKAKSTRRARTSAGLLQCRDGRAGARAELRQVRRARDGRPGGRQIRRGQRAGGQDRLAGGARELQILGDAQPGRGQVRRALECEPQLRVCRDRSRRAAPRRVLDELLELGRGARLRGRAQIQRVERRGDEGAERLSVFPE